MGTSASYTFNRVIYIQSSPWKGAALVTGGRSGFVVERQSIASQGYVLMCPEARVSLLDEANKAFLRISETSFGTYRRPPPLHVPPRNTNGPGRTFVRPTTLLGAPFPLQARAHGSPGSQAPGGLPECIVRPGRRWKTGGTLLPRSLTRTS